MGNNTGIEWTDSTWNPIRGCTRVSEGCRNCYAERHAYRFKGEGQPYEGLAQLVNGHAAWTGKVDLVEKHLLDPLKWGPVHVHTQFCKDGRRSGCECAAHPRPRRIFVNSMSDLFHENVPDEWVDRIFAVMALCPQHTFQILTKRPERMLAYLSDAEIGDRHWNAMVALDCQLHLAENHPGYDALLNPPQSAAYYPLPNVQPGVSVEDQKTANERIPLLLQTPAAVRFISAEPLLRDIDLRSIANYEYMGKLDSLVPINSLKTRRDGTKGEHPSLDWVICGGESGPGARPMHPDWARGLRDQCVAAGVPFFFKQWGEWTPGENVERNTGIVDTARWFGRDMWSFDKENLANAEGHRDDEPDLYRAGKKAAGSLLDGREWKEFPCG